MSKGVLLIANNNSQIDYVKQSVYLAKRIQKFLDVPISIITDSPGYLKDCFDFSIFENLKLHIYMTHLIQLFIK